MIVHFGANTAPLRLSRVAILWMLAFLIGPWPALSCVIHCLYLPLKDAAGIEFFLCDAPHTAAQHDLQPPPVRYDLLPLALTLLIGGLIVMRRLTKNRSMIISSVITTPDPPPPRATHLQLAA
ncbi:hypothetical protein [Chloroflexus sp.]|uniref:hypothetical protein n=1 Tax=Chloroflexus sp. TaxID=1904827 RepID=UPI00298F18D7|nr:hypothetical protein [Chloroflexus sp.]MDW8403492.1 hypothetical protein [Chloroflexus sp.]